MDSTDWRYFSWSSLFFPIRGVEIQELVPRCLKDHNRCRSMERTSLDVEDSPGTTCISVWAVQCAESQQGRRPGRRKRQKSNLVFTSPQKKKQKKNRCYMQPRYLIWCQRGTISVSQFFCFKFYLSWFVQKKLQDDFISRFSNNVNAHYNLCWCSC